jgi:hypothetical protein
LTPGLVVLALAEMRQVPSPQICNSSVSLARLLDKAYALSKPIVK